MKSKNKHVEGPACACGKVDLYEEWKKLNKDTDEESSDSTVTGDTGDENVSASDEDKEGWKRVESQK